MKLTETGSSARMLYTGIHRGELFGYAPTNAKLKWDGIAAFTFRDDRIADLWVLGDLHTSRRRLRADMSLETWELLSYIVTVFGLPLAIAFFLHEQRKERDNEEEEVYQLLSDAYIDFMKLVLANPDLKLRSQTSTPDLTPEQEERTQAMFEILISLFERAYLLAYEDDMNSKQLRRWRSWEDYMREWCRREDFRAQLPRLLQGEDPDFAEYIRKLSEEETDSQAIAAV